MATNNLQAFSVGSLTSKTKPIKLHSRQGVYLFTGQQPSEDKHGFPGLTKFAQLTTMPYFLAAQDDPWADYKLILIDEALEQSRLEIEQGQSDLNAILSKSLIQIESTASSEPVSKHVVFGNPLAYRGATLLLQMDNYVINLLSAAHFGLITREASSRSIRKARRAVIRAFMSATGYKNMHVTRSDAINYTENAKAAELQMGHLPNEVIAGTKRSKFAPAIRLTSSEIAPNEDEKPKTEPAEQTNEAGLS